MMLNMYTYIRHIDIYVQLFITKLCRYIQRGFASSLNHIDKLNASCFAFKPYRYTQRVSSYFI